MKILHTEASRGWSGQEIRILTEAAGINASTRHKNKDSCVRANLLVAQPGKVQDRSDFVQGTGTTHGAFPRPEA